MKRVSFFGYGNEKDGGEDNMKKKMLIMVMMVCSIHIVGCGAQKEQAGAAAEQDTDYNHQWKSVGGKSFLTAANYGTICRY